MKLIDTKYNKLSSNEVLVFNGLKDYLSEMSSKKECLLLYRGDEVRNIKKKIFLGDEEYSKTKLLEELFFIGDKARHLYLDADAKNRLALKGLNDCSFETFEYIFDKMNSMCRAGVGGRVEKCTSDYFRSYFKSSGVSCFLDIIKQVDDEYCLLKIRDYYLYILHTAGTQGVRPETMLVSATTNEKVAQQFSRCDKKNKGKILIHYFLPAPFYRLAVAPQLLEFGSHESIVTQFGLPTYEPRGLFPEQQEVAVKGALFPHFILGVELIDENLFVVNDAVREISAENYGNVLKYGFGIDQKDFLKRVKNTAYKYYAAADINGNFEQFENN